MLYKIAALKNFINIIVKLQVQALKFLAVNLKELLPRSQAKGSYGL